LCRVSPPPSKCGIKKPGTKTQTEWAHRLGRGLLPSASPAGFQDLDGLPVAFAFPGDLTLNSLFRKGNGVLLAAGAQIPGIRNENSNQMKTSNGRNRRRKTKK
jgi:hypothetical protein